MNIDDRRFELQNYIWSCIRNYDDPLINFIAAVPIADNYKFAYKLQRPPGYVRSDVGYLSPHHQELLVFLHKVGLRGRI